MPQVKPIKKKEVAKPPKKVWTQEEIDALPSHTLNIKTRMYETKPHIDGLEFKGEMY